MRLAGERVLHIKGVHVHLEEGEVANLVFDVIDGGTGPRLISSEMPRQRIVGQSTILTAG
jgi:hypothetical protein